MSSGVKQHLLQALVGTGGRVDFPCGCSARAVAVPVCVPASGVPQVLSGVT